MKQNSNSTSKLLSGMKISNQKQPFGKQHFTAILKQFKNDLSSERPRPQNIIKHTKTVNDTDDKTPPSANNEQSFHSKNSKNQNGSQTNISPLKVNNASKEKQKPVQTTNIKALYNKSYNRENSIGANLKKGIEEKLAKYLHRDKNSRLRSSSKETQPFQQQSQPQHKLQSPDRPMNNVSNLQTPQIQRDELENKTTLKKVNTVRSPSFSNEGEFHFEKGNSNLKQSNSKSNSNLNRSVRFIVDENEETFNKTEGTTTTVIPQTLHQKKGSTSSSQNHRKKNSSTIEYNQVDHRVEHINNDIQLASIITQNNEQHVNIEIGGGPSRQRSKNRHSEYNASFANRTPQTNIIVQYSSQKNLKESNQKRYTKDTEASLHRKGEHFRGNSDVNSQYMLSENHKSIFDTKNTNQSSLNDKTFTFKPQLNDITKELAKRKKQMEMQQFRRSMVQDQNSPNGEEGSGGRVRSTPRNIWDNLYHVDLEKKKHKEAKLRENSLLKEMEQLKQCTFKPQLSARSQQPHFQRQLGTFYERNLLWQEQIHKRVKDEQKKDKKEQKQECTFKPNLKPSASSLNIVQQRADVTVTEEYKGVDIFLQRLKEAQKRKIEEAEVFLLPSQKRELNKEREREKNLWKKLEHQDQTQPDETPGTKADDKSTKSVSHNKQHQRGTQDFENALTILKGELRAIDFKSTQQIDPDYF